MGKAQNVFPGPPADAGGPGPSQGPPAEAATVGDGACVWVAQCWTATGEVDHAAIDEAGPVWSEAACPALSLELPPEGEVGAAIDEAGAPIVQEPGPEEDGAG